MSPYELNIFVRHPRHYGAINPKDPVVVVVRHAVWICLLGPPDKLGIDDSSFRMAIAVEVQ